MVLSSYRMHRIYLAATMGYGLGSDDPEELSYYKKLRKEIDDMKGACEDWKKATDLGDNDASKFLWEHYE